MKLYEVLEDISKLVGMTLKSIRPGADIILDSIEWKENRIMLICTGGVRKSRPFAEIASIWTRMCANDAVHVDEVLSGSGSSRNQPETLLANLPYVEWFRYDNKKHIAYVGKPTHPYGTLKEMNEAKVEEYRHKLNSINRKVSLSTVIVVASDIGLAAKIIERSIGLSVQPLKQGLYRLDIVNTSLFLISHSIVPPTVLPGTYTVLKSVEIPNGSTKVEIDGMTLYAISGGGTFIMILK